MVKKADKISKDEIVATALRLAGERGWTEITLADIAQEAGVSLAILHDYFEDRIDILAAYGRILDRKVMENIGEPDPSLSPRDRLFDLMMERFDILGEQREGVCSVLRSFCLDPKQALISLPHLGRSMSWMLEAAGIETCGIKGAVRVAGLTAIYLKTLRTWKNDDSQDLSKTMAELDKNLGRAEQWAGSFGL